jgi:hypothetical protein
MMRDHVTRRHTHPVFVAVAGQGSGRRRKEIAKEKDVTDTATIPAEQSRMRALAQANEVRRARAELKRQVADGQLSAAELILQPPPAARAWPLVKLLLSQPQWGHARCSEFLSRNHVGELKAIGALTERQRRVLAASSRRGSGYCTETRG